MYHTVFAFFYFVFEGNFQVKANGGLFSKGKFNEGFFLALRVGGGGGGAYISRGLYKDGLIFGILVI